MADGACTECGKPVHGRGWCSYHYLNWLRSGDPLAAGHIRRRRWTDAEDEAIRNLYGSITASQIAEQIGRTENAVWLRAKALGLDKHPAPIPWSEAELATLSRCYTTEPPAALAKRLGRSTSSVYQQARVLGLVSRKTLIGRSAVTDYFDSIDTAEKAYILGLMASDGNVHQGRVHFGLQEKDAHLVAYVRDRLFPDAVIYVDPEDGFRSFAMTCHPMATTLATLGIVERKSRILKWPTGLPKAMLRPFLLGYYDGDGCAFVKIKGRYQYPDWSVSSGSYEFIAKLKEYVEESTEVMLQKIRQRKGKSLYEVAKSGRGAYIINRWLHEGECLGLSRKTFPLTATLRYEEPPPPGPVELLAMKVQAAGQTGLTRKEISVRIFRCNRTKTELDNIVAEVLALPGYHAQRRHTIGKASAMFIFYDDDRAKDQLPPS